MDDMQNTARTPMRSERLSLRSPNCNICYKAIISRTIEKDEFMRAVGLLCERHPKLIATIEIDENNDAWYIPGAGSVGVEFFGAGDGMDWMKWFEITDGAPFDYRNGPLVKIGVISDTVKTNIIIIGNHLLGDGLSYLNLTKDLLLALDGRLDATPQLPYEGNRFRAKMKPGILLKLYVKSLNKAWRDSDRKRLSEDEYKTFFYEYRKKYPPKMRFASIKEPELSILLSACKKAKITVNEAVAAALSAAIQENNKESYPGYNDKPIRLSIAVNIRNDLINPDANYMANYATSISMKINYNHKRRFIVNALSIGRLLRKNLNNPKTRYLPILFIHTLDPDFLESAPYAAYGDYDNAASKKLAAAIGEKVVDKGFGLTNLGKQDIGSFNSFILEDFILIPCAYPAHIMNISVMTVNGRLDFCYRYSDTDISDARVGQISAKTIEYLYELIPTDINK